MLVYTAFSAAALAQVRYSCSSLCAEESPGNTHATREYSEHEAARRQEPPVLHQRDHTNTRPFSSKILYPLHSDPARAAAVPVHIRHCVFIL